MRFLALIARSYTSDNTSPPPSASLTDIIERFSELWLPGLAIKQTGCISVSLKTRTWNVGSRVLSVFHCMVVNIV